jgi:hypothetical protein
MKEGGGSKPRLDKFTPNEKRQYAVPTILLISRSNKRLSHLQNVQYVFGALTDSYEPTTGVSSRRYSALDGTLAACLRTSSAKDLHLHFHGVIHN